MMIIVFICTVIIQVLCYVFVDNKKIKYGRIMTLVFFLLSYFILLPYGFYQIIFGNEQLRCGLPVLGMYLALWFVGGGLTIITHLLYYVEKKAEIKRNEN